MIFSACKPVHVTGPPSGARPPESVSPEVSAKKKITFRVHAPKAEKVVLSSSDLPGIGRGVDLKKAENGVWEATTDPVASGAYRYNFNVEVSP